MISGSRVSLADALSRMLPWVLFIVALWVIRDIVLILTSTNSTDAAWAELLTRVKATRVFALVFGAFGFGFGLFQRNLRLRVEQQMAARIQELEKRFTSRIQGNDEQRSNVA